MVTGHDLIGTGTATQRDRGFPACICGISYLTRIIPYLSSFKFCRYKLNNFYPHPSLSSGLFCRGPNWPNNTSAQSAATTPRCVSANRCLRLSPSQQGPKRLHLSWLHVVHYDITRLRSSDARNRVAAQALLLH